jgi:hypothetical protein
MEKMSRIIVTALIPVLGCLNVPLSSWAADEGANVETSAVSAETSIVHNALSSIPSGQRVALDMQVTDPAGVDVVRVYFKALEARDFVFVAAQPGEENHYLATLPAPAAGVQAIDYLVLVKNNVNQVVKSQTFRAEVEDGERSVAADAPRLDVYTELAEAPTEVTGFSDNITLDVVESAAKFGTVAGLYSLTSVGGSGGAAAAAGGVSAGGGATAAGTVVATSAGIGVVGTVAAVAAVAGTAAAASSSGGGDSGSDSDSGAIVCNTSTTAGNALPSTQSYNLGQNSGTFDFTYQALGIKDRFIVTYGGASLLDTGCVSGGTTRSLSYSGNSSIVTVEVVPNCAGETGTAWEYTVACPN